MSLIDNPAVQHLWPALVAGGATWVYKAKREATKIETLLGGTITAISELKDVLAKAISHLPDAPPAPSVPPQPVAGEQGFTSGPAKGAKK